MTVLRAPVARLESALGGPARTRVVVLLAAVLATSSADMGMIGALARELEAAFQISQAKFGLLATASSGIGALVTVPMGALADHVPRTRLLIYTIVLWSIALLFSGAAGSYAWLLASRLALGGAIAASGPLLASLLGDYIPVDERAKVYGWILSGELVGAGLGLLAGGAIATVLPWRYGFWLLAVLGLGLAAAVLRWLPEPARGGASRVVAGAQTVPDSTPVSLRGNPFRREEGRGSGDLRRESRALWEAFVFILRIRTVRILVVSSSIGYFFFAGLRTFTIVFVQGWFRVNTREITLLVLAVGAAALAGTMLGGRMADQFLARGHPNARIIVPALTYTAAALLFAPGLLTRSVLVALPFFLLGTTMLAAANPPLDAARLDIVTPWLWGRAESARTVLRLVAEAIAPLSFGLLADWLGGSRKAGNAAGLRDAFLLMLVPLLANGLITLWARRSYVPDMQAAEAEAAEAEAARRRGDVAPT